MSIHPHALRSAAHSTELNVSTQTQGLRCSSSGDTGIGPDRFDIPDNPQEADVVGQQAPRGQKAG